MNLRGSPLADHMFNHPHFIRPISREVGSYLLPKPKPIRDQYQRVLNSIALTGLHFLICNGRLPLTVPEKIAQSQIFVMSIQIPHHKFLQLINHEQLHLHEFALN
jgi:hypothetical protein